MSDTSNFVFLLKIILTVLDFLCFHAMFRIICASSVKTHIGILIVIAFNLLIALGSWASFPLCKSFSTSFMSIIEFSE